MTLIFPYTFFFLDQSFLPWYWKLPRQSRLFLNPYFTENITLPLPPHFRGEKTHLNLKNCVLWEQNSQVWWACPEIQIYQVLLLPVPLLSKKNGAKTIWQMVRTRYTFNQTGNYNPSIMPRFHFIFALCQLTMTAKLNWKKYTLVWQTHFQTLPCKCSAAVFVLHLTFVLIDTSLGVPNKKRSTAQGNLTKTYTL